jgi:ATP-binding cassette subfamily B protein
VNKITPSRLITTVTSDVDAVKNVLIQAFVGVFVSVVTIIGGSILLISISPKIGIIVLGILFFLSFSFNFLFRNARKFFTKSQENIDNLNRVINENILSSFLIRVLNTQDIEEGKFDIANTNAMVLGKKIVGIFSVVLPLITFLASLCTVVVVYLGGSDLYDGNMTVGNLNALVSYVSLLIFPVLSLSFIVNNLTRALSSIKRIREVLDIVESKSTGTIKEGFVADIEFKDVSLELDKQPILKGINITIKKGQRVAIIGPTGAGKSQLFNLLSGLNVPTGGKILVNGVDINEYDRDYIYTNIGLVFQENIIFNATIKENITFGEEYEFADLEKLLIQPR